jgi:hypothetical protein
MSWTYRGAKAVLATMHGKEAVIAPAMRDVLGMDLILPAGVDTDALGTFTGEVRRVGTMREVAIRKARLGMQATGLRIGIASEGSFGPHPVVPFFRAGLELMVLVDDERGVVISESLVADETNHDEILVESVSELDAVLPRLGFPTHALVVGPNATTSPWWRLHPEFAKMRKGIVSSDELVEAVAHAARISEDGRARVLTDMRAHFNPTRMQSIASLSTMLARRIAAQCPECGSPGFGKVSSASGLPCIECGEESIVPRGDILGCIACDCKREKRLRPPREFAEPGECPQCNP